MQDSQQQSGQSNDRRRRRRRLDLGTYVSGLSNAFYKGLASEVASYDLSPLDVQLMMICKEMNECTATQLAQQMPIDASRVSRLVTVLADRGLLSRRRLRSDRRIVMLRLTPAGEQMASELSEWLDDYYAKLTEGLSDQQIRTFSVVAREITANYEAIIET